MAKFGVYRVEDSVLADPHSEVVVNDVIIDEGVYWFRDRFGRIEAAYPIRSFYILRLED